MGQKRWAEAHAGCPTPICHFSDKHTNQILLESALSNSSEERGHNCFLKVKDVKQYKAVQGRKPEEQLLPQVGYSVVALTYFNRLTNTLPAKSFCPLC